MLVPQVRRTDDHHTCCREEAGPDSEISLAIWQAVATAPLERDEEDFYTQARFDAEELRRSMRLA
jgi:hypothetical protein